jgi:hypothetical protein
MGGFWDLFDSKHGAVAVTSDIRLIAHTFAVILCFK